MGGGKVGELEEELNSQCSSQEGEEILLEVSTQGRKTGMIGVVHYRLLVKFEEVSMVFT